MQTPKRKINITHFHTICTSYWPTLSTRDVDKCRDALYIQCKNLFCLPFLTYRFHHVVWFCISCGILHSKGRHFSQCILPLLSLVLFAKFLCEKVHTRWDLKQIFRETAQLSALWILQAVNMYKDKIFCQITVFDIGLFFSCNLFWSYSLPSPNSLKGFPTGLPPTRLLHVIYLRIYLCTYLSII